MVIGDGGVDIVVKLRKFVYIIPNLTVRGVENMCAVSVDGDARNVLGVAVAANMAALFHHKARFAAPSGLMSEHCPEESGTDYQKIIVHGISSRDLFCAVHPKNSAYSPE
jgi:ABC-type glucose/galactose transport system permease subunit